MIGSMARLRDQRGAVLVWVAASMVALCAITALAVDFGMLVSARTEAQRAADAAALAGAASLIPAPTDEDAARALAAEYAALNPVRGVAPTVLPEDVDVIVDEAKVRVRVRFEAARGNAFQTWFARVFGIDEVDISATAAAEAQEGQTTGSGPSGYCPLPLALIDGWTDDGDGIWSGNPPDSYDPGADEAFGEEDHGDLVMLKLANEGEGGGGGPAWCEEPPTDVCNAFEDSWHCWWREVPPDQGGGGGTDVLGPRIYPATECGPALSAGDDIWEASGAGNKQSLVTEEFRQLIESDPDVVWYDPDGPDNDTNLGCVVRTSDPDPTRCLDEGESGRIRKVPIVNPTTIGPASGSGNDATIQAWTGVFVDRVSCAYDAGDFAGPEGRWNVYIRLMRATGSDPLGDGEGDGTGTFLKVLRLVE